MSDKSVDAFRTISEVAEDLDLPQHVLRFWETRFAQIKPMKRGGGRRYYRPDDVELLKGIRHLLYVKGFTIRGVQRILKENGNRFVMAIGAGDFGLLDRVQTPPPAASADTDEPAAADVPAPSGVADADLLAADALPPAERRKSFASLMRRERGAETLPREATDKLQEVIMDLLECKRLLDQVR
ncbi:MerR family transcriptional regulator [Mangrovibrevibacter kandeliae]|uniref:MerR family transcriptional regulator n=1 Tax=Mangrovibrevibacter kandeliae TaxID=2968473 RepID=UPI0021179FF4|nr:MULTISPECIES: MerR family transcriptional regulator [unclassified Aurantimonas]MCQ8781438.1 MerR family transcriptional regulator [Aurantimonas sp. CSK15Z-1]MCW4114218.1 MerR family transcriptional regulator [Aurantimonas sp. MSK8Z-1]